MSTENEQSIAVVTGGSKGIGRAICLELAAAGSHVVINYMGDQQGALQTLTMVESVGGRGEIQQFDVSVAKNYLTENEMAQLQRLVSAYLDIAEDMALRKMPMTMQDWETRLNKFIEATDRKILQDAGKVTAEIAKAHAETEFEKYRIVQDRLFESDFDKMLKQLEERTRDE
jgi:hypothetical protein